MDPMDPPPHFPSRVRYDPFPPPHHFPEPNYYPPHPSFAPPPPPPPPPRHHHYPPPDRHAGRDHHHHYRPPDESRLYLPYPPDPPPPPPRVSERVLIHRGPHHPHPRDLPPEPWEGEQIRVYDDRPSMHRVVESDWEEERQDFDPSFRGNNYPLEDHSGGRRRYRTREDGIVAEEDPRDRSRGQQIRVWDGVHDVVRRRSRPHFDQLPPDPSLGPSSRSGLVINRGEEGSPVAFERRHPPPSFRSSGHPHSDIEVSERKLALVSDAQVGFQGNRSMGIGVEGGFRENHYMGNRGKRKLASIGAEDDEIQENYYMGNKGRRKMYNGGNSHSQYVEHSPVKRPPQKASALGRIQSGISVWNRIEEKPSFFSHNPSPPPPPPPPPFPSPGFSNENQQEIDSLDLSYKSNNLVAKVVLPSSPKAPSPDGKGPCVVTPKTRVVKKKKVAKREKVVVSVVSGSQPMEGVPKRSTSGSTKKVPNHPQVSEKALVSSSKPASGSSSQPAPKKVKKMASVNKSAAKKPSKTVVLVEGSINEDHKGDDKITESRHTNDSSPQLSKQVQTMVTISDEDGGAEQSTILEGSIIEDHKGEAEITGSRPTDDTPPQLCQQGPMLPTQLIENSNAEQSIRNTNFAQGDSNDDMKEEVCVIPGGEIGQNCSSIPVVSNTVVVSDAGSRPLTQDEIGIMEPLENGVVESSSKASVLVDTGIAEEPSNQVTHGVDDVGNSAHSDIDLAMSSSSKQSSSSGLGVDQQVMPVGFLTSSSEGDFLKCKNLERETERAEKQQKLEVIMATEELEILGERMSDTADALLHSDMQDMPGLSTSEVGETIIDDSLPNSGLDKEDNGFDFSGRVGGLPQSDFVSIWESSLVVPMCDSMSKRVEQYSPSTHSGKDFSADMTKVQDAVDFVDAEQSHLQLSNSKSWSKDKHSSNKDDKSAITNDSLVVSKESLASQAEEFEKVGKTMLCHHPLPEKTKQSSSREPVRQIIADAKVTAVEEPTSKKPLMSSGIPRVASNRMSLAGSLKEIASTNRTVKSRSWHRNDTASSSSHSLGNQQCPAGSSLHKELPKKLGRIQSSYIRKGNSLIRNSVNDILPPRQSQGPSTSSKKSKHVTARSMAFGTKASSSDHMTRCNPSFERPKTPPLPVVSKLPNCTLNLPKDSSHPMSEDPITEAGVEAEERSLGGQTFDLLSDCVDVQNVVTGANSDPSNTKRMMYVKRKSNQLVAASGPDLGDSSTHPTKNAQKLVSFTSSDLYFRRKKNQLVRNVSSSDDQHKQGVIIPVDCSNSDDQGGTKPSSLTFSTGGLSKKRLAKVLRKTHRHSKFSRVWTLKGDQSCKNGFTSSNRSKVMPYLFPWKRTIYCKNIASNNGANSNKRSLSLISRKLQLTRKRDTIYTVSTDGFSLRKARVVSIGGASLKWSKSIERHSKKASEEATLAVAEVERKKRERKIATTVGAREKNGNCIQQGERIFRVGSARYKMDSSRHTLIRIPDEQSSHAVGQQSGNNSQISFVPRRLLIGNDEYVRIGNGNQLVRDPKKLIRILASEKVRWSLHTARLRLAKKQQYCQFFTRFGKCNKIAGKCPYIHDPAKVAICTKFLRGVCSDAKCKLTHKIIPERMPDCSYFLQGLCTNTSCPYRHVNVNPNAAVCDGFLRGYCADGDECRKKHSYVCPLFEATGKCPQGSTCKLHHPKNRNKSKKRKRSKVRSNSRGRYFGPSVAEVHMPVAASTDKHDEKGGDASCTDGWFADYVSLDNYSDSDGTETCILMGSEPKDSDIGLSSMHPDDLDALIKPVRIMNKANSTNGFISL